MLEKIKSILKLNNQASWDDVSVNIIVSTGRTGTEFMAKFFNNNFQRVYALHEPGPDLFELGTGYIKSEISDRMAFKQFKLQRQKICEDVHSRNCSFYIESNTYLMYLIPLFKELFNNYKIVFVIRDGRNYVRSCFSKIVGSKTGGTTLFIKDDDSRNRIKATDFKNDLYSHDWHKMDRFERLCWHWVKKNNIISHYIKDEKNVITVKYEDIFNRSSNYSGLREIINFFELKDLLMIPENMIKEHMAVKANANPSYDLPSWEDWSKKDLVKYDKIAGNLMQQFGYL